VSAVGGFEVDLRAGQVTKRGLRLKLQEQPCQVLTMLLGKPGELVSRVARTLLRATSQAHFIKAQVVGRRVSHRSAFVENVIALIVVTLALAVLTCLAAVAPAVWTFATAAAAETHIPVGLSQCLSVKDDPGRLACYDELAGRPAKGARAPSETFGEA